MKKNLFTLTVISFLAMVSCQKKSGQSTSKNNIPISKQVTTASAWKYLEDLQTIADKNKNNRSVGSPGGIASADYIFKKLESLGLKPVRQFFTNQEGSKGQNIIVDIPGKNNKVVMFGAHFDSVKMGPGLNDNATGVAILLEIISKMVQKPPTPGSTARFAFWDSEEAGIAGSRYYVEKLSKEEKEKLSAYVNVDMVGTKNPEIMILDSDNSSLAELRKTMEKEAKGVDKEQLEVIINGYEAQFKQKPGSKRLEEIMSQFLKSKHINYKDDLMTSTSTDTAPFIGITPTTGIISVHDQEMASGELLFAPCYHQPCDDIKNVDRKSLNIALETIANMADQLVY